MLAAADHAAEIVRLRPAPFVSTVERFAGVALHALGRLPEARKRLEQVLARQAQVSSSPGDPETIEASNEFASVLIDMGQLSAARMLLEQARAEEQKPHGPATIAPGTDVLLGKLAAAEGHFDLARQELERAIPLLRDGSADTIDSIDALGNIASSIVQAAGGASAESAFPYPIELDGSHFLHTGKSGRRRCCLASRTASSVQLVRLPIDPDTGRYGTPESPVLLPPGVSDFVISPDGESLCAIDPTDDEIRLVQ